MSQVQVIDQTLAAQISRIEQAIVAAETHAQLSQVIALADAAIAYAKSLGKAYDEQRQRALSAKVDAEDRLGRILLAVPKWNRQKTGLFLAVPVRNRFPRRPWRTHEIRLLRELFGRIPVPSIALRLDRTPNAVRTRASRLGLGRSSRAGGHNVSAL